MTNRKTHVTVSTERVISYVIERGITNVTEVAEHFDIHPSTARRHLDGGWFRGDLIRDEYDEAGRQLLAPFWRYGDAEKLEPAMGERAVLGGYPGGLS